MSLTGTVDRDYGYTVEIQTELQKFVIKPTK